MSEVKNEGLEVVAWQARFVETNDWGKCTKEHHDFVKANPSDWPGYEVRQLCRHSEALAGYAVRDARIAELENDASYYAARYEDQRAELAAIKAQGVVMPEREVITNTIGFEFLPGELQTVNSDDLVALVRAARLNAAPAQQVSVIEAVQIKGTSEWHICRLADGVWRSVNDLKFRSKGKAEWWAKENGHLLAAAPAAPAADAYPHGHPLHREVFMALESWTGSDTLEDGVRALIAALAAHRAKGVV